MLASTNVCHYLRSVFGQFHWVATFGAIKELRPEFAFDAVDLIDEGELIHPERSSRNGERGMLRRRFEPPQAFRPTDSSERRL